MKKIMYILILVILLCLTSCEFEPPHKVEEVTKEYDFGRFIQVYHVISGDEDLIIYVDKETKVQYLAIDMYYGGGITIMLDENGKPLLYDGDFNNFERSNN